MGCRPVSSRLITIRLKALPFSITIIQAYAPAADCDDDDIEDFYNQLQEVIDQTPKKDILAVQGDWNTKKMQARTGKGHVANIATLRPTKEACDS